MPIFQAVQPHLRKCFDAIASLTFGTLILGPDGKPVEEGDTGGKPQSTNDILAMNSPEGESVGLGKNLKGISHSHHEKKIVIFCQNYSDMGKNLEDLERN